MAFNAGEIIYKIIGDNAGLKKALDSTSQLAGKAAADVSKVSAAALGGAVTALGVLSKKAVESFASYEQLTGGVETLFKTGADVVNEYADNAYKNAGMSANAYMETVTGFSASLLQGLKGDTQAAAEVANQAVVDMSDNANKMGTDMSLIQNAYQGFAKQNYTMLDNLKLGYGGTQSEMARLINDSGVLGDTMTVTAETVNQVSFDKVIEAIHHIQSEMGITGTTALEASTTIEGSVSAAKGAWQNFLTGIADPTQDLDRLTDNLVDSILTVSDNLLPRIQAVLPQISEGLTGITEGILPEIPQVIDSLLPSLLEGADGLVDSLINVLARTVETSAPTVAAAVPKVMTTVVTALHDNAESLTDSALDMVLALADGLAEAAPVLAPAAVDTVLILADRLIDNAPIMVSSGTELINSILNGLVSSTPVLVEKMPALTTQMYDALIESVDIFAESAVKICNEIGDGLIHHDWADTAQQMFDNLYNAMDEAQKKFALWFDNTFNDGKLYSGDIANVSTSPMLESWKKDADFTVDLIEQEQEKLVDVYDRGSKELKDRLGQNENYSLTGSMSGAGEAEKAAKLHFESISKSAEECAAVIEETTKAYAENNNEASAVTAKNTEAALKNSVSDKFRELETQALENGYDDSWLLARQRAFIETLDCNSDVYKEYNLKLLQEQQRSDDAAVKEAESAAKKQRDALEKEYNSLIAARDGLSEQLQTSTSELFSESSEADKRTGEKDVTRKIDYAAFEKKLAAKKQLTSKLAELMEQNAPDSLIQELLKQDPEAALYYANELLKNPVKLGKLSASIEEDAAVSGIIANLMTENSEQFSALGISAGELFGESFTAAFHENFESAFKDVFDDEYTVSIRSAVAGAGNTAAVGTAVRQDTGRESSSENAVRRSVGTASGSPVYKIVDINGAYVAGVVNAENSRNNTISGG